MMDEVSFEVEENREYTKKDVIQLLRGIGQLDIAYIFNRTDQDFIVRKGEEITIEYKIKL